MFVAPIWMPHEGAQQAPAYGTVYEIAGQGVANLGVTSHQ
jgi:hypothetical protein